MRAGPINVGFLTLRNGTRLRLRAVRRGDQGWLLTLTDPAGPAPPSPDDAVQLAVELRFNNETLESQAAYLASLAEAADANAQAAEEARRQLEREIAERRQLEQQLRQMATTDALTGAMNRGHFLTLGQREVSRVQALGLGLAVVMLDVDHFKMINDQHGHPAGDAALQHLVGLLRAGTRRVDLLGRMGGEEFAVVLPAVTDDIAMEIAERLRAMVARAKLTHGGTEITMTISLGVASLSRDEATLETCLARADAALYAAKHGGRNRVMRGTPAADAT
jgi:diguanylate cyclase (GGDEF)-like protein